MSNELATNKLEKQHNVALNHVSEVFQNSSVCAVSSILLIDNKPRKIFRSVVFLLFIIAFFYQCTAFLCYVLKHPTIVDHTSFRPEKFVSPAYTFCNYNFLKRSKFCEKYPNNCTKPDREFCFENPRFCGIPDTWMLKDDIFNIESREELYQLSHEAEDMVEFDGADDHKPIGPSPRVNENEKGITGCFSYYERVDSSLDPFMKMTTPAGTGISETISFDPQENELIYPEAMTGLMFDVHSPFEASNPFDTGFFMKPGYFYRITVTISQEEMLPNDCLNYTEVWLKNNRTGYRSQSACKQKCIGDMVLKCFNCTEPIVLYPYPNANFCSSDPDLSEECKNPEEIALECFNECKDDCLKMKYSYKVQENYQNRYAHSLGRNESRKIQVIIDFPNMNVQKIVHKPQFQVLEIFSLIGGLLAFWLGLSTFQIIEIFDCLFQIGKYLLKQRAAGSESSCV